MIAAPGKVLIEDLADEDRIEKTEDQEQKTRKTVFITGIISG